MAERDTAACGAVLSGLLLLLKIVGAVSIAWPSVFAPLCLAVLMALTLWFLGVLEP